METRAGRREWVGLAVLALPTLLVSIDVFVLLLALPRLSTDLDASSTEQLWIMDVYGFMVAGFLITMGTLGDRIGRRRLLLIGAAGFGAASVLAAYSTSAPMLIAARALLGIAGATLAPSTLGLISNMFTVPRQRATAIGVWMACFMGGAALGPLVAGVMLNHFWWGSVFLLGVPAMVLLLAVGPVLLPEYRDAAAGRIDLPSVALSLAAILPVVYGLKELARGGWAPLPLAAVVAGAVFGRIFVRRQRRLADPLLDLRLFARREFSAALGSMMFGTMLMGAIMMFIAQYFQLVHGLSPLRSGLCMLPGMGGSLVSFLASPHLTRWVRPAYLIGGGMIVSVGGLLLIAQAGPVSGLAAVMTGFAVTNLGAGPMVTLGTDLVVGSAPKARASSAGALNETSGEFGFALGIAALGSAGTAVYRDRIVVPGGVPAGEARDSLAGAVAVAGRVPARLGAPLLDSARAAFMSGMQAAAVISAVLLVVVAVVVATLLRHTGAAQAHPEAADEPEPARA
ncbi:MFS transporter [Actinomadura sp. DC4]|uniref:MFS transporter n=1 Tax=Actinomadura sp. DC4 TaxID=3055069 RepID=UPI0025B0F974|nr:MFS transporter [Actinomadura sp. DC4]MDN3351019.1 MFS transporter [Actinomadura sp. DC4]